MNDCIFCVTKTRHNECVNQLVKEPCLTRNCILLGPHEGQKHQRSKWVGVITEEF